MEPTDQVRATVPYAAWLAADHAYDHPDGLAEGDELHQALAAASPHIRIDELDALIQELTQALVKVPLLGRKHNGLREGLDHAIQLLTDRRRALRPPA